MACHCPSKANGAAGGSILQRVTPEQIGYSVTHWAVEDGLPANFVDWLAQTPDGYLWWPTAWGVARFDGHRFRSFSLPNAPTENQRLEGVFADSQGRLWVWNWTDTVAVFARGRFERVSKSEGRIQGSGVIESSDGGIWLVQQDSPTSGFLERIDGGPHEILPMPAASPVALRMHVDSEKRIWAWKNGGLYRWEATGLTAVTLRGPAGESEARVSFFYKLPDGSTATLGRRGVYVLRDGSWQLTHTFPAPFDANFLPHSIAVDGFGNTWIGTRASGLWMVSAENQTVQVQLPDLVYPDGFGMGAIYADRENNVWAGSRNGLYQLQRVVFRRVLSSDLLKQSEPLDLAEDGQGGIWVVAESGKVIRYPAPDSNSSSNARAEFVAGLSGIYDVESDARGDIWLAGSERLWRWAGGELRLIRARQNENSGGELRFQRLFNSGTEILARCSDRLCRIIDDEFVPVSMPAGADSGRIAFVHGNRSGTVRALVSGTGLMEVTPDRWSPLPMPDSIARQRFVQLHVDPESRTWLAGGHPPLARLENGVWTEAPLASSEMPVEVIALASDDENGLWGLTEAHGAFRIDRDFQNDGRSQAQWFGVTAGLPSNAGRGWSKGMMKSRDGRIWACTAKGVGMIDPRQWNAERDRIGPPQVHIEEVFLDDVLAERTPDGRLLVPPGVSRLQIQFTALGLNSASENRFRHQLTGVDRSLRDSGTGRSAVYHDLPPGEHRFHVTAANSFGVWNETADSMLITVLPAWWQRASVQIMGGLLLLGAAAGFFHLRLRQSERRRAMHENFSRQLIQSQEDERKRIARELHDSLGQNLLAAKNQLFLIQESGNDVQTRSKLQQVSESVTAALEEARAISHNLRPFQLERLGLTRAIRSMVRQLTESTRIPIDARIESVDALFPPESEINIYRILQEALSNVFKHADASRVELTIERLGDQVRLAVRDDGRGFDFARLTAPGHAPGGLGLGGLQERANLLHGSFHCASAPGQGTTFTFQIPIPKSISPP